IFFFFFFSSRRRHTRWPRDWSSDVCSSDLVSAASRGLRFDLPQSNPAERRMYEVGKRIFFYRGGPYDFACATCHSEDGKRIRLRSEERRVGKECRARGWL